MTDPHFEFTAIYDDKGMNFTPHGWASPLSQSRLSTQPFFPDLCLVSITVQVTSG